MKAQDPYTLPIKQLARKINFDENGAEVLQLLLQRFIALASNQQFLERIVKQFPLETEFSSKLEQVIDSLVITPNEMQSKNCLTPYHLSFLIPYLSSIKSKGQFFTPYYLADYVIDGLFTHLRNTHSPNNNQILLKLSYVDIACGTGNLLVALLYHLLRSINPGDNAEVTVLDFINSNLWGFELDLLPLLITQFRIAMFVDYHFATIPKDNLFNHLQLGNVIVDQSITSANDYPYVPLTINKRFDVIFTNPPYMVYGLRSSQKYPPFIKKFLRKRYYSAQYKLPLYSIFMERAVELLAPNGVMAFITPDSFLLGKYYSRLRKFLLRNTEILSISLLKFEPFNATIGNTVISFFKRSSSHQLPPNHAIITRRINNFDELTDKQWNEHQIMQKSFYTDPLQRFHLFFSEEDEKWVHKWNKNYPTTLGEIATLHTGIRSRIGQRNIISTVNKGVNWKRGLISGRQIKPFIIQWEGHWINVDPSLLWSGGYDKSIVERPKLLLRQTGSRIVAAVDTEGLYHLNNIHTLILNDNSELSLEVLCTILNSADFNRYYQLLSCESSRTFAQIDMDLLLTAHIPIPSSSEQKKLIAVYHTFHRQALEGDTIDSYNLPLV